MRSKETKRQWDITEINTTLRKPFLIIAHMTAEERRDLLKTYPYYLKAGKLLALSPKLLSSYTERAGRLYANILWTSSLRTKVGTEKYMNLKG